MDSQLIEQMHAIGEHHWWFQARQQIILALLRRYERRQGPLTACDLGCGTGQMLKALAAQAFITCGMDPAPEAVEFARRRGAGDIRQGHLPDQIPFAGRHFDLVLLLDVLEHIVDDAAALARAAELVGRDGLLICTVPAGKFLWSARDARHGHQRRYNRAGLQRLFANRGLRIEKLSYFNTLLFPIAVAHRLLARLGGFDAAATDLAVPPRLVNQLLATLFATEKHLLSHANLPCGLSLLCLARKT